MCVRERPAFGQSRLPLARGSQYVQTGALDPKSQHLQRFTQNPEARNMFKHVSQPVLRITLPSEFGTHKTVKARFWPWIEPFSARKSLQPFWLFSSRSTAALCIFEQQSVDVYVVGYDHVIISMKKDPLPSLPLPLTINPAP